jgi:hypothetical protein
MASKSTIDATDGRLAHERQRLRSLAHWYREFAERTGNPAIWEARLRTAKELEQEADLLGEESADQREAGAAPSLTTHEEDRLID